MTWFRMYHTVLHDPKIHRLTIARRWRWVELLCIASMYRKDTTTVKGRLDNSQTSGRSEGDLPPIEDIAFHMRIKTTEAESIMADLVRVGLVDQVKGTERFRIHDWHEHQRVSDTSNQRVKRFRERHGNADVTLQSRYGNALDTDTDTEKEENPPLPPSPSLGPEYTAVGEYAIQLGMDVSWGTWVSRMGLAGHSAADIRAALDESAGAGKLSQAYAASKLRGWATEGRPKSPRRNGRDPAPVEYPPIDPEKLKPKPIRIHDRMTARVREASIEHNKKYGFPEMGVES